MNINESQQHSNIDESDMGQLHGIHFSLNAIAEVQRRIKTGVGLVNCTDCGEKITEDRRAAVQGCTHCIHCQTKLEKRR